MTPNRQTQDELAERYEKEMKDSQKPTKLVQPPEKWTRLEDDNVYSFWEKKDYSEVVDIPKDLLEQLQSETKSLLDAQRLRIQSEAVEKHQKTVSAILRSALDSPLDEDVLLFSTEFVDEGIDFYSREDIANAVQRFKNKVVKEARLKCVDCHEPFVEEVEILMGDKFQSIVCKCGKRILVDKERQGVLVRDYQTATFKLDKECDKARADERKIPTQEAIKSKLKSLWHRSLPLDPLTLEIGNLQWAWVGDTIQGEPAENLPFTATLLDCNQQEFETEQEAKAWCEEKLVELIEEIYPIFSLFKEQPVEEKTPPYNPNEKQVDCVSSLDKALLKVKRNVIVEVKK